MFSLAATAAAASSAAFFSASVIGLILIFRMPKVMPMLSPGSIRSLSPVFPQPLERKALTSAVKEL